MTKTQARKILPCQRNALSGHLPPPAATWRILVKLSAVFARLKYPAETRLAEELIQWLKKEIKKIETTKGAKGRERK